MPGRHRALYPCILRRLTHTSISVCSSAWPTCSEPFTFGGGITIVNGGAADDASAVNRPRSSQNRYRRTSTSAGAYWGGSSAGSGAVTSGESSAAASQRSPDNRSLPYLPLPVLPGFLRELQDLRTILAQHPAREETGGKSRRGMQASGRRRASQGSGIVNGIGSGGLLARCPPLRVAGDERRVHVLQDRLAGDDDPLHVLAARHPLHDRHQDLFEDRPQSPGPRPAPEGLVGDGLGRVVGEF